MTHPLTDTPADVQWADWTGKPEPAATTVIRYFICSDDQYFLYELLHPDEQRRANRFRQLADQQRFVAGRGCLRWLAGQLLGIPPAQVRLATGPFGKPELINPSPNSVRWHVNVSHSGDWVLLAISNSPVGVDLEWVNPDWPYQELIPVSFGADDRARLDASAEPRLLFYTYWTRKESLLKATGQGLADDLTAISSSNGSHQSARPDAVDECTWQATSFWVAAGYVGAAARQAPVEPVRFFTIGPLAGGQAANTDASNYANRYQNGTENQGVGNDPPGSDRRGGVAPAGSGGQPG